ncbi:MAG: glycoside hydrolase family 3 N-terminal domain-containing protein [Oscillospiraceae bacterium]
MKKLLLPLAGALLIISGLSGCQSTELVSGLPTPSVVTESTAADSSGEPGATSENSEADGQIQSTEQSVTVESPAEDSGTPEQRAAEILSGMTAAEKAGQVILARYPGENALSEAQKYNLGGNVMFGVDFRGSTPEEITAEIAELQSASKLRMLFAADEEGGTVVRISKYPQYRAEPFPAQAEVLSQGLDAVSSEAQEISGLMSSMGLNMNLAPVCDLPRSETDFIYDRAFSTDPQQTSRAVGTAVESYGQSGLICALKHFPGYGNNLDTHTGISIDERPLSEITELDLSVPGGDIRRRPVVMVSHNIVNCIDDSLPGSLSGKMYAFLREQGFTGAAMTDDLSMDAVGEYCGENAAAVTALKAGADILCCTDYASAAEALTAAVESGEIPEERIDEAVTRVLLLKLTYGIIE